MKGTERWTVLPRLAMRLNDITMWIWQVHENLLDIATQVGIGYREARP
jgi:hypothetical protein